MKLPNLPRVLKKREAAITPRVFAWFEKNYHRSVALEIKIGNNVAKPHQIAALGEVQKGSFSHKFPDTGRRQPFDGIVLKNADAFVVTCNGTDCIAMSVHKDIAARIIKVIHLD